jgi:hypothetical protein
MVARIFISVINIIILSVIFLIAQPQNVYAYLDPGSGSLVFQVILASLLGVLFSIKTFWKRIISFFRKRINSQRKK